MTRPSLQTSVKGTGAAEDELEAAAAAPVLISRLEAARRCGVCLETFDKHVRPNVQMRRIGRRLLVDVRSLLAWSGAQESARSIDVDARAPDGAVGLELGGPKRGEESRSGVPRKGERGPLPAPMSPAALEIRERLRTKHRAAVTSAPKRKA